MQPTPTHRGFKPVELEEVWRWFFLSFVFHPGGIDQFWRVNGTEIFWLYEGQLPGYLHGMQLCTDKDKLNIWGLLNHTTTQCVWETRTTCLPRTAMRKRWQGLSAPSPKIVYINKRNDGHTPTSLRAIFLFFFVFFKCSWKTVIHFHRASV